jgi:hypothetical protein
MLFFCIECILTNISDLVFQSSFRENLSPGECCALSMDVSHVRKGHIDLSSASNSSRRVFSPEDEGTNFLRQVGNYLLNDIAYHPIKC